MVSTLARGRVHFDSEWLRDFCERNHLVRFWLYGSVLRADFRPDSDIDILVEYDPKHIPSLFKLGGMAADLEDYLGREVDLKTPGFFPDKTLARVLETADLRYDAH